MSRLRKVRRSTDRNSNPVTDEMVRSIATTPTHFIYPLTCDDAWVSWYGAKENISALRDEIIETGIRLEGFTRSNLKLMPNGMLLSTVLLDDNRRSALESSIGRKRMLEIMPLTMLDDRMREIIGQEVYDTLQMQIHSSSSLDLKAMAENSISQLGEIIEVGGFSRELATAAVMLGALFEAGANYSPSNTMQTQYCFDMAIHLYLQMIPVRAIQICILEEHLPNNSLYPAESTMIEEIDHFSPIFETDIYWSGPLLLSASLSAIKRRFYQSDDTINAVLETVQSFALATSHESRFIEFAVTQVLDDANERWAYLCEDLRDLDVETATLSAEDLDLDSDLLQREIFYPAKQNIELIDSAQAFRRSTQRLFDNLPAPEQIHGLVTALAQVNKEIAEAVSSGKGDFELLGQLSKKGAELHNQRNQLTSAALSTAKALMVEADKFLSALEFVELPPSAPADVTRAATHLNVGSLTPPSKNEIETELFEINTHLESELKKANAEIFRLNSANSALQTRFEVQGVALDQSFQDLVRQHVQGHRLNPEELLKLYSHLAPERLVVLDSAWKSARQSENFAYPERLNEHLGKLIYDYLDQVHAGTAMGQAGKEIFAGAFAAKESQTVSQDHSMRAQREFIYAGETRFFEYRLRVGNGWGAVEGMRLYFDVIDGKVVVAYVGQHLDQPSTN